MNQCLKIFRFPLIAHHQAPEVLQPQIGSLNDPPPLVAPQLPSILMRRYAIILALRDDWFNLALHQQGSRWVAVIGAVANQAFRLMRSSPLAAPLLHLHLAQSCFQEFDLRRGSRLHENSERSTRAICQNHKLRAFAALGLANFSAPFLALTNIPSRKHSFQRIFFWSLTWSRKACHKFNKTLLSAQSVRRR